MRQLFSILFITLCFMGLLSLLGCFSKKKSAPSNIGEWLESNYPGQYEVLATPTNFTDKEYYMNKRESVIALKSDKEVQFILHWVKKQDGLGVNDAMVQEALQYSQSNVATARRLVKQIQDAGISNFSVGVSNGYAFILIFAEPTPATRDSLAQALVKLIEETDESSRIPFEVMIMEPAGYGTEFQQVVPAGHWKRLDSWHHNNQIMELSIPLDPIPSVQSLSKQWRFNTRSERLMTYVAAAHKEAVAWAKKNIKKPVTIEEIQMVQFGLVEEDGLKVEIDFPVYEGDDVKDEEGETGEIDSYVTGVYDIDHGDFRSIRVKKVEE